MSVSIRQRIPQAIITVSGLIMVLEYFTDWQFAKTLAVSTQSMAVTLAAFAMIFGIINLLLVHGRNIITKKKGEWYFSLWLLITCFVVLGIGVIGGTTHPWYTYINSTWVIPVNGATYALTLMWLVTAAYRAFRLQSADAVALTIPMVLVIFSQVPIGESISPFLFPRIGRWFIDVWSSSVQKGFIIGVALGGIITGVRTILGYERGFSMREQD